MLTKIIGNTLSKIWRPHLEYTCKQTYISAKAMGEDPAQEHQSPGMS